MLKQKIFSSSAKFVLLAFFISVISGCGVTAVTPPRSLFQSAPTKIFVNSQEATPDGGTVSSASKGIPTVDPLNPYTGYLAAIQAASNPQANADDKKRLLREGMAMVEYRCGLYFDVLGKAIQDLSFSRKETSLVGGVVQGSLGLANQSAKMIANTGAAFGFATSTMDAYQEAFLYTPEIDTIRRLVLAALSTNAGFIATASNRTDIDYGSVISLLKQYESVCQPGSIRSLVNQAVGDASAAANANKVQSVDESQTNIAIAALAVGLNRARVTEDDMFYLYWLQSDKYNAAKDAAAVKGHLAGFKEAFKGDTPDPDAARSLIKSPLAYVPKKTIAAWDERIATLQKGAAPAAPAAPAPVTEDAPKPAPPSVGSIVPTSNTSNIKQ